MIAVAEPAGPLSAPCSRLRSWYRRAVGTDLDLDLDLDLGTAGAGAGADADADAAAAAASVAAAGAAMRDTTTASIR